MNFFFILGFVLMQFDSLPYFFKISVYRPYFSIVFFLLYLISTKRKIYISKEIFNIIVFIILLNMINMINIVNYQDNRGFIKMLMSSTLGIITLISSFSYFKNIKNNRKRIYKFGKLNYISLMAPLSIGILQLGYVFNLFSYTINKQFFLLFSYRNLFNRVQFGAGEPSWGVRLIFITLVCSLLYKKNNVLIFLTLFLIVFTYSTYGYLYISLVCIGYLFLKKQIKLRNILKISILFLISIGLVFFILKLLKNYLPNEYMKQKISIILSLTDINKFLEKLTNDGSAFQRIVNPIIGLIMGIENPILGVGSEYYYKQYLIIVKTYFEYALKYSSVALGEIQGITAKNFFMKILAENGVIIFIIFIYFLYKLLQKIRNLNIKEKNKNIIYILYSAMIFNWFTGQDSWMFINNIVYISFILSLNSRRLK